MTRLTREEALRIGPSLHARCLWVQDRYLQEWHRYCTHWDYKVRNDAGETYCRLKAAWERLEAAYVRLVAIVQNGGAS